MREPSGSAVFDKVVVRFPNEVIRGFADKAQWAKKSEAATVDGPIGGPRISFRRERSSDIEMLSIAEAKAVFFVNSFEGNQSQSDIRFHDEEALMEKIWVRVTFADNEIVEGMIDNTLDHLRENGFYLYPTDPAGNNYLVYVLKKQIVGFNVLGLRNGIAVPAI